ncbi:MAG: AMP-binding protein, partial [Acidobacteria bacterium]|nr:AMP-binding protein [Acidobacteriota bacterium]
DGTIEFLGRRDQQAKIRGFRIEPGEIEAALGRHPAVGDALVTLREPAAGDRRLVAYVVPRQPPGPGEEELRALLRRSLPDYMIPWAFVTLEALPLTPNGKVDRRALPVPAALRPQLAAGYLAPRGDAEQLLAAVWSQALGVDRVGVYDDFFALGGDSIVSLRLVALARQRGLPLRFEQLFSHPTIAALAPALAAAVAAGGGAAAAAPAVKPFALVDEQIRARLPEAIEDAYPLTQLQLGMLYHLRLAPGSPAYHNVSSWHLSGPFAPELLRQAVGRGVARHPALRTGFDLTGYGEPLQLVHAAALLPVGCEDLRGLPPAAIESTLADFVRAEHARPFALGRPPLMRLHLHRRTDASFQLTVTECHAITDGWSTSSTLAEIFADYLDLAAGRAPRERPPLAATCREFVALERQALASEECEAYWRERLAGASPAGVCRWPAAGREGGERRARKLSTPVSGEVLSGLERLARMEAIPLKSVLLAAHAHVLGRLSGQRDVLTGVTVNGRPESLDGGSAHGLFLNTLPLRFELTGGSFRDLARAAFEVEREALPFRRYPLAAMQKSWGRQALVETNFNYVNFHSVGELLRGGELELLEGGELDLAFSSFEMGVTFASSPLSGRLRLELECDAARFGGEQAKAIEAHYLATLHAMAADPEGRYEQAQGFPAGLAQALREWNDTTTAYPAESCLHELFESQAARRPEAIAALSAGGALTYGELNAQANRLARQLRGRGVGPEVLVGLCVERSLEMVVGLLGILKAGGAYLPLDPSYPTERLVFMIEDGLDGVAKPVLLAQ